MNKTLFVVTLCSLFCMNQNTKDMSLDEFKNQNKDEISDEAQKLQKATCYVIKAKLFRLLALEEIVKSHYAKKVYVRHVEKYFSGSSGRYGEEEKTRTVFLENNNGKFPLAGDYEEYNIPLINALCQSHENSIDNSHFGWTYEYSLSTEDFLKGVEDAKSKIFSEMQAAKCI